MHITLLKMISHVFIIFLFVFIVVQATDFALAGKAGNSSANKSFPLGSKAGAKLKKSARGGGGGFLATTGSFTLSSGGGPERRRL